MLEESFHLTPVPIDFSQYILERRLIGIRFSKLLLIKKILFNLHIDLK